MNQSDRRIAKDQYQQHEKHLASVKRRAKHFKRKRRFADQFEAANLDAVASKLRDCEEAEAMIACSDCASSFYVVYHCHSRVCPLCSYKLAMERHKFVAALTKQMAFPKFLTLTLPSLSVDPRAGIQHLRRSFARLRARKIFRGVKGGYYQIELKPKEDGWHVHLHTIFDAPYIPYQQLFSAWTEILGVAHAEIDIRALTTEEGKHYATKYASKSADFDMNQGAVVEWYLATVGMRLCATYGDWFNVKLAELDPVAFPPPRPRPCPCCGSVGTMFYARDGPFLFGPGLWRKIESSITHGRPLSRRIAPVAQVLASVS